jgi:hypothetical protein
MKVVPHFKPFFPVFCFKIFKLRMPLLERNNLSSVLNSISKTKFLGRIPPVSLEFFHCQPGPTRQSAHSSATHRCPEPTCHRLISLSFRSSPMCQPAVSLTAEPRLLAAALTPLFRCGPSRPERR